MIIVAFDPGLETSWAKFNTLDPWQVELGVLEQIGIGRLRRPCPLHIAELLADADGAVVEEVGARPDQGVSGMFTFGLAVGCLLGGISATGKAPRIVSPQEWKKSSRLGGLEREEAKRAARAYATELWPQHVAKFRVVKNHGLAEAALMARWYFLDGEGRDVPLAPDSPLRSKAPSPQIFLTDRPQVEARPKAPRKSLAKTGTKADVVSSTGAAPDQEIAA